MKKTKLTLFNTFEKINVDLKKVKRIERKEKGSILHFQKTSIHVNENAEEVLEIGNIKNW